MSAIEQQDSHRPPSDGGMAKEEFIRVGTTVQPSAIAGKP